MRYSTLLGRTKKSQKQYDSKNQTLLQQAGYIDQVSAGVYAYLPLGFRVLNNISQIVREEMDAIGGQEILMSALVPKQLWDQTQRWDLDVAFKTRLNTGTEFALGWSHEEVVTPLVRQFVHSYRDLPFVPYQIQTKFRNESRAKSGIMRGREFLMKDMYSFHVDQKDLDQFYEKVRSAYQHIFNRVGLGDKTFLTFASGGVFAKFSHEFQTLSEAGEDTIYLSREKNLAINKEVFTKEVLDELGLKKQGLEEVRAIEVGNIFKLSTRFSQAFNLLFTDEYGEKKFTPMGCYGLGPSRVMGTIVEVCSDDKGIVWPESVAPFKAHLLDIHDARRGKAVYEKLCDAGIDVLWDDRDVHAGEKFSDADFLGIPVRLVVSSKTGDKIEYKNRTKDISAHKDFGAIIELFTRKGVYSTYQ